MSLEMRDDGSVVNFCCACETPGRHALAALALYGQPYGFTHEHAAKMREALNAAFLHFPPHLNHLLGAMQGIESRIAALLPPETTP